MFSETLNHRSVAQTCTPNSRRRKIDDAARPQPRSSTRIPGRKSSAEVSHSVSQSEFAPPLTLARTHSGWYCEERGKLVEMNRLSEVTVPRFSHDALSGEVNEEAQRRRSSLLLAWRLLTCSRLVSTNSRVGPRISPESRRIRKLSTIIGSYFLRFAQYAFILRDCALRAAAVIP